MKSSRYTPRRSPQNLVNWPAFLTVVITRQRDVHNISPPSEVTWFKPRQGPTVLSTHSSTNSCLSFERAAPARNNLPQTKQPSVAVRQWPRVLEGPHSTLYRITDYNDGRFPSPFSTSEFRFSTHKEKTTASFQIVTST